MRNSNSIVSPPMLTVSAEFDEFDEFNEFTASWDLDYRQLKRGSLAAQLKQMVSPTWTVGWVRVDRSAFQQGSAPAGMRSFAILGAAASEVDWCGSSFRLDTVAIFANDRDFRCVSPAGFAVYALSFAEFELAAASQRLGLPNISDDLKSHDEVRLVDHVKVATLRRLVNETLTGFCSPGTSVLPIDRAQQSARDRICEQLVLALTPAGSLPRRPSWRKLTAMTNKTLDYIETHMGDGITVRDVSKATGVSRRTLEYAFQNQFDTSPKKFINGQRLVLSRRDLLRSSGEKSIADVANRWGFWHMGQFARDYRRQFGELPSQTTQQ